MPNRTLSEDYLRRARHRIAALETLFSLQDWADVVRESQEVVELALKGLLRHIHIEPPRIHDVSEVLLENVDRLPENLRPHTPRFAEISRRLRRDRELAFYGTEDLTPGDFYKEEDATESLEMARWLVGQIETGLA